MARGGYGRGSGVPLGERRRADAAQASSVASHAADAAAATVSEAVDPRPAATNATADVRAAVPQSPPAPDVPAPAGPEPGRHCWVSLPVDGSRPRPGLLLEWRQVERGRWEGQVAYMAPLRPGRWALVAEWVPAELLAPP